MGIIGLGCGKVMRVRWLGLVPCVGRGCGGDAWFVDGEGWVVRVVVGSGMLRHVWLRSVVDAVGAANGRSVRVAEVSERGRGAVLQAAGWCGWGEGRRGGDCVFVYAVEEAFDDAKGDEAAHVDAGEEIEVLQHPVLEGEALAERRVQCYQRLVVGLDCLFLLLFLFLLRCNVVVKIRDLERGAYRLAQL